MLRKAWYLLCRYLLILLPDRPFSRLLRLIHYTRLGVKWYPLNLRKPQTFNEKINYLKLYHHPEQGPIVADKIAVREYVKDTIGEDYLIPLIGIYADAEAISLPSLPQRFVLKTNHGSGWNLICRDKDQLDWPAEKRKLSYWLSLNAYYLSREWQYKSIEPRLICEELLDYELLDYKLFCSRGKAWCIQVDSGRFSKHQRSLFDLNWNLLPIRIRYPQIEKKLPKPKLLPEMIRLAEQLAQPFLFCRIDLYVQQNRLYFGEITLHPGGGAEPFGSYEEDRWAGNFIDLSK